MNLQESIKKDLALFEETETHTSALHKLVNQIEHLILTVTPETDVANYVTSTYGESYYRDFKEVQQHLSKAAEILEDIMSETTGEPGAEAPEVPFPF